tara:strand:+ start:6907 stop:8079 length:1173 start_codon:yes stop_codon:yes gene_type:complete
MKKINFILILVTALFLTACGSKKEERSVEKALKSNDLSELKEVRNELAGKQSEIAKQLEKLAQAISKLDTVQRLPLVSKYDVEPKKFKHYIEVQGSFDSKQNVMLFAEYGGILNEILVNSGDRVSKGQVLARIDDGGLSQQLYQAEVQAELMKTTFERQEKLWNQKIGSEIQLLQAKASYEAQEKLVSQLNAQLAKTTITAPFSGLIDEIITEAGNLVAPGQSGIMRIVNLDKMYVEADVPEAYIQSVSKERNLNVIVPVLKDTLKAQIALAGNFIKAANRSFRVEALVENKDWEIKPNMNAKLMINDYSADSALLIPQNIVSEDADGNKFIYVANDKVKNTAVVKRTFIKLGTAQGEMVEVLEGLKAGESVIVEGARTVLDGQKVEILN